MRKHPLRTLLLGGAVAAAALAGGQAPAQTAAPPPPAAAAPGPVYDPAGLPATKGTVARYSLAPRGDVDGLILGDGTEVHLPPHLGTQLVYAVRPGDAVTVRGLRALRLPLVSALSVTNDATGATVTDNGPPPPPGKRGPREVAGGLGSRPRAASRRCCTGRAARPTGRCSTTAPSCACRRPRPSGWPTCWCQARRSPPAARA